MNDTKFNYRFLLVIGVILSLIAYLLITNFLLAKPDETIFEPNATRIIVHTTLENETRTIYVYWNDDLNENNSENNWNTATYNRRIGSSLCPENESYQSITCECAENTITPCMAECFTCERKGERG